MEQPLTDEVFYYYDAHPTEGDLLLETPLHARVIHYLMEALAWMFRGQLCAIHENYGFYQTDNENEPPYGPDIAIIMGIPEQDTRSYRVGIYGPPPHVAFEIASEETWRNDLVKKPVAYGKMGIAEYYAYDPYQPPLPLSRRRGRRLFGWQRDPATGLMREMRPDSQGRLWSMRLGSYLVPDGELLRLYDHAGSRRLTAAEAEKLRADEEARKARRAARRAKEATQRAQIAEQQMQEEAQHARVAEQQAHIYAAKLRELGIDPQQLL
jgi:Uma2 family endonuclease